MSSANPNQIRKVLRSEVREFRGAGGIQGWLSNLLMAVVSISLCSVTGVGMIWLVMEFAEADYEDSLLTSAMVISPLVGFVIGFFTRDSLLLPGRSDLTVEDYEFTRDDGGLGCILYALHMMASSVYHSVTQMFVGLGKDRSKEFELAVSIVAYLLNSQQPVPTSKLAESLVDQGVPRERVRDTLALLRKERVVEPGDDILRLSPSLQPRFSG